MKTFRFIALAAFCFALSTSIAFAQEASGDAPKPISAGVLNGKASSLVKPAYPAAARAVRASGAVNVQVTIDENGDVISAAAVSGHPLLRAAAVTAAQESKFSPTKLNGQPVKVTGVIVYNFVAGEELPPNFYFVTGTLLATMNKSGAFAEGEKNLTGLIGFLPPKFSELKTKFASLPTEANAKRAAVAEITDALAANLDGADKWKFDLGLALIEISAQVRDPQTKTNITPNAAALRASLSKITTLIADAPPEIEPETTEKLNALAAFSDEEKLTGAETVGELVDTLKEIFLIFAPQTK